MKKLLIVLLFCSIQAFGANDTLLIVNKGEALPKIIIKDKSNMRDKDLQKNFYNLILNDLRVSSNFQVIEKGEEKGNYVFEYTLDKKDGLSLNVIVRVDGAIKSSRNYSLKNIEQYPFLAHKGVKDSVKNLGLAPIEWMDHKILIARSSGSGKSQIIMADYTLTYQVILVDGGLNIFPKWANQEQTAFYYTAYDARIPTLYRFDLKTNTPTRVISSGGMLVASDVSRDGNKILLTMAPSDQPDVHLYDIRTKSLQKITQYSGADVNAQFIEDEKKIVFVSDRLGYPTLFIQTIGSEDTKQLVWHARNNTAVSTFQNYLVYSSREQDQKGVFNIYLMSTQSDYIRQLTANGKNLFPRFSSDGGSIVFIKYLGEQTALGVIRVNANKSFHYPLKLGRILSIDW